MEFQTPALRSVGSRQLYKSTRERLSWLTDQAIAAAFSSNPIDLAGLSVSLGLHGLPISGAVRFGPVVVQRFQRTALRHWITAFEDEPPGRTAELVEAGGICEALASLETVPVNATALR